MFTAGAGTVYGLAIEPDMALTEYLDRTPGLGMAGWALDRTGPGTFATSIAPGLRDVLLIGKVYEAPGGARPRDAPTPTTPSSSTPPQLSRVLSVVLFTALTVIILLCKL